MPRGLLQVALGARQVAGERGAPAAGGAPAHRLAAVRARLVRAPRAHGRTVTFTVACVSGTCPVSATVKAGSRVVGRGSARIRSGARRTLTIRLTAAGRRLAARRAGVRVTVHVAVAGRTLASRRLTLR